MTSLSDIQRILLPAATQRADGSLLPAPDTLTNVGARITKAAAALVRRGFAEERETNNAAGVVRDEGHRLVGVFITSAGAAAIGVGGDEAGGAAPDAVAAVCGEAAGAQALRGTKTGLVLALLGRGQGATLHSSTRARPSTWQPQARPS